MRSWWSTWSEGNSSQVHPSSAFAVFMLFPPCSFYWEHIWKLPACLCAQGINGPTWVADSIQGNLSDFAQLVPSAPPFPTTWILSMWPDIPIGFVFTKAPQLPKGPGTGQFWCWHHDPGVPCLGWPTSPLQLLNWPLRPFLFCKAISCHLLSLQWSCPKEMQCFQPTSLLTSPISFSCKSRIIGPGPPLHALVLKHQCNFWINVRCFKHVGSLTLCLKTAAVPCL